jgi:TolB-like protein/Flp pilus assembly protein TadD
MALLLIARSWTDGVRPSAASPTSTTLAVLPFDHIASDDQTSYLANGLTEELITFLGRRFRGHLAVIAPTSAFAVLDAQTDEHTFARELDADFVLTGSLRRSDGQLRVTARLSDSRDGSVVWAGTYRRSLGDLLSLQESLAVSIGEALAINLLPREAWARGGPRGTVARVAFLQADHLMRRAEPRSATAKEAQRRFEAFLRLDPGYALGWVRLARATLTAERLDSALPDARRFLHRAMTLDEELPEAHLLAGKLQFYWDLDFRGALRSYQRALAGNPSLAGAYHGLAAWYSAQGRHTEALATIERAVALDPLSPGMRADTCWLQYFARRWQAAVDAAQEALELDPELVYGLECRSLARLAAGHIRSAVPDLEAEAKVTRRKLLPLALGTEGGQTAQEEASWHDFLASLQSPGQETVNAYWKWRLALYEAVAAFSKDCISSEKLAVIQAHLGHVNVAVSLLEDDFDHHPGKRRPFLAVDPEFDPLRGVRGFQVLERRIRDRSSL